MGGEVNARCRKNGHDIRLIDGMERNLIFQQGKREIFFFSGKLEYCRRKNCGWEKYHGSRLPYMRALKINMKMV